MLVFIIFLKFITKIIKRAEPRKHCVYTETCTVNVCVCVYIYVHKLTHTNK